MITEDDFQDLVFLEESKVISTADKNLRSKIDSILRSLENLTAKKMRIEFEIKKQKASLSRKRQELKKVTKSNQKKLAISLESGILGHQPSEEEISFLRRLDSRLLQESNQLLDD